jgi:ribosomal protein S18 acetylase RimI-like enzyme
VKALLDHGDFLVLDQPKGGVVASIYVRITDGDAEFGLLAVAPEFKDRGLEQRLAAVAEHLARAEGCRAIATPVIQSGAPQ